MADNKADIAAMKEFVRESVHDLEKELKIAKTSLSFTEDVVERLIVEALDRQTRIEQLSNQVASNADALGGLEAFRGNTTDFIDDFERTNFLELQGQPGFIEVIEERTGVGEIRNIDPIIHRFRPTYDAVDTDKMYFSEGSFFWWTDVTVPVLTETKLALPLLNEVTFTAAGTRYVIATLDRTLKTLTLSESAVSLVSDDVILIARVEVEDISSTLYVGEFIRCQLGDYKEPLDSDTVFSGDHDDLTNVTADQHHSESHTIASHSDTTATGAELETLTDGSNADSLHAHAHSATTGKTADDHHAKSHAHNGADGSGTVAHSDTTGQGTDDHHNEAHTVESHSDVTITSVAQYHALLWDGAGAWVNLLLATVARTGAHSDTTGQTTDDHHAKSHAHDGADGSGTVAHSDTTGKTATDHQALVTLHADLGTNLLGLSGQELDLDTQTANKVFAGPTSGGAAKPTFRSLVLGDISAILPAHTELDSVMVYQHDDGSYETCKPTTFAGRYWELVFVEEAGETYDGQLVPAGKRYFFMHQFCLPIYDVPGYCVFTSPGGEALTFIDSSGDTQTVAAAVGLLGTYTGVLEGINPVTGDAVTATFTSGVCGDYEGQISILNDTTGDATLLRIDSDGLIKQ